MHHTVIDLKETDEGWEATQEGGSITGTGETAARAAEDYCRQIAEQMELQETEESGASEEAGA